MKITRMIARTLRISMERLRATINDPLDQIRLLTSLAAYQAPGQSDPASLAMAALCRRAALSSLARATADWQPSSSTQAHEIIALVGPLFDTEALYAADHGDAAVYQQLREIRAAIIADLNRRGSQLPELITATRATALPGLVLAWQLYADASREVELLTRNPNVVHPAFFLTSFEALAA